MSATKIGENATNILKLLFFMINLHFVTSNQISSYRKLNLPLTRIIYFVFLPLEMKKRLEQTKVYHAFCYFVLKETAYKPLKVAPAKNPFLQCVLLLQLASMFIILCDNCKALLFMKVIVTLRFF